MYNNANVLFKTSFVDGVSRVERFALKHDNTKKLGNKKSNTMIEDEDVENKRATKKIK